MTFFITLVTDHHNRHAAQQQPAGAAGEPAEPREGSGPGEPPRP